MPTDAHEVQAAVESKPNRIDPIQLYKLRYKNKLTVPEIAEHFGVCYQAVYQRLNRLSELLHTNEEREEYEQVRPALLGTVEQQLLASCLDPDKLAKASLNNVAYAFTQINMARRLEEGKSTSNVGILSKLVQNADDGLFEKKPK